MERQVGKGYEKRKKPPFWIPKIFIIRNLRFRRAPARKMPFRIRVRSALQASGSRLDWIDRRAIAIMQRDWVRLGRLVAQRPALSPAAPPPSLSGGEKGPGGHEPLRRIAVLEGVAQSLLRLVERRLERLVNLVCQLRAPHQLSQVLGRHAELSRGRGHIAALADKFGLDSRTIEMRA